MAVTATSFSLETFAHFHENARFILPMNPHPMGGLLCCSCLCLFFFLFFVSFCEHCKSISGPVCSMAPSSDATTVATIAEASCCANAFFRSEFSPRKVMISSLAARRLVSSMSTTFGRVSWSATTGRASWIVAVELLMLIFLVFMEVSRRVSRVKSFKSRNSFLQKT
ncbi:hypothetical protein EDD21DRAFT_20399, partial [Dissophora ornata]